MSYATGPNSFMSQYLLNIYIYCNKCVKKILPSTTPTLRPCDFQGRGLRGRHYNGMAQAAEILCCNIKGKFVPVLN
jgi:hypothetical protein